MLGERVGGKYSVAELYLLQEIASACDLPALAERCAPAAGRGAGPGARGSAAQPQEPGRLGREEGQLRLPYRLRLPPPRGGPRPRVVLRQRGGLALRQPAQGEPRRGHALPRRPLPAPTAAYPDRPPAQRPDGRAAALARARHRGRHALHPPFPGLGAGQPPRPGVPRGARRYRGQRVSGQRAPAAPPAPDRRLGAALTSGGAPGGRGVAASGRCAPRVARRAAFLHGSRGVCADRDGA